MTPDQFRALLDKLGMTQIEVARFLDFDGRQVRRWVAGEVPVPVVVEILLTYMVKRSLTADEVLSVSGVKRHIKLV